MRFLSLFSGIEAASVAWEPLGWRAAAFAEIDPFASAVLAHRYPEVPNLGDVTKADFDAIGPVDLLVGGSPCQSFSVAGRRLGMDDPRGNLALEYARVAYRKRPRWFVYENVPGLLSSDGGRDFGTLLAALSGRAAGSLFEPPDGGWRSAGLVEQADESSYGLAWRVLDAQYVRVDGYPRAVPQRRERLFVVGRLGDWRGAAAVLIEREGLRGNPAPRRTAGKGAAPTIAARTRGGGGLGTDFDCDGGLIVGEGFGGNNTSGPIDVATARSAHGGPHGRLDFETETFIVEPLPFDTTQITSRANGSNPRPGDPCHPITAGGDPPSIAIAFDAQAGGKAGGTVHGEVSGTLHGGGEHGQRAAVATPICFSAKDHGQDAAEDLSPTLRAGGHASSHANAGVMPAFAFDLRGREGGAMPEGPHATANLRAASGGSSRSYVAEDFDPRPQEVAGALTASWGDGSGGKHGYGLSAQEYASGMALPGVTPTGWAVRRLTPRECERLQGFPDDWTLVPYRGRPAADGPRYKSIGNSKAINVVRWIGMRIQMVDDVMAQLRREAAE